MSNINRYLAYERINFSCRINAFISLFKHIPGISKLFSDNIYHQYRFKNWLALIGVLLDLFSTAITNTLETYIIVRVIPEFLLGRQPGLSETLTIFLGVECFAKCFGSNPLFKSNRMDYMFLNHFMVNPAEYYRFKALRSVLFTCIPLSLLFGLLLHDWVLSIALCCLKGCFCLLSNLFYLSYFDQKQKIPNVICRRVIPLAVAIATFLVTLYGLLPTISILLSWELASVCLLLIAMFFLWGRHKHFEHYQRVALHFKESNILVMSVSVSSTAAESGNSYLEKLNWKDNKHFFEQYHSLEIHDYMTKAFYKRLGRGIRRQQLTNIVVVLFIYVILGFLLKAHKLSMDISDINNYSTLLVPISLLFTQADRFTQMFFYNIDIHMLKLNAYPAPVLQKTALRRFRDNLLLDIFFSVIHFLCMLVCVLISNFPIPFETIAVFGFTGFCILAIQEIYENIIYYYVQPYSNDMSVQSPVIKCIGLFGNIAGLCCIIIRQNILSALPILFGIVVAMCIGFCAFSGLICHTFRLKH